MKYITLNKDDPRLESYLLGTFDLNLRARLVPSLRQAELSRGEGGHPTLTFELTEKLKIQTPSFLKIFVKGARLDLLPLCLNPIISTCFVLSFHDQGFSFLKVGYAIFAILFFHSAVFFLNDYSDHLRGIDAVSARRGSQIIEKGFITAQFAKSFGTLMIVTGFLVGIPLVMASTFYVWVLAPLAPLSILGFCHRYFGLKYHGVGDFLIFICFGPLLTSTFSLAIAGTAPPEVFHLGILWGWLAVVVFQFKSFENLFADGLVRSGTFLSRLGFDQAKSFLIFQLISFCLVWISFAYWFQKPILWLAPVTVLIGFSFLVGQRIWRMRSPLSSNRIGLARHFLFWLTLGLPAFVLTLYLDT